MIKTLNSDIIINFIKETLNDDIILYERYIGSLEVDGQLSDGEYENTIDDFVGAIENFKNLTNGIDAPAEIKEKWGVIRRDLDFGNEFTLSLMITDKLRKSLENATTKYLIPDLARLKL
jgi:hypothetical protein